MTFDEWAVLGKDEGMERGHHNSVEHMFEMILKQKHKNYSIMDIGCGNGWVVRKFQEHSMCKEAHGLDGATHMIEKAKKNDSVGTYFNENIEDWAPIQKYDIIFSMETLYYFQTPENIINNIYQDALNAQGMFIMGIDHYRENEESLDWGEKFNLEINTLTIKQWVAIFKKVGFSNITYKQVEAKGGWKGTLVIEGFKL